MPPAARITVQLSLRDNLFFVRFSIKQQRIELATCRSARDLERFFIGSKVVDKHTIQVTPEVARYISNQSKEHSKFGHIYALDKSAQTLIFADLTDQVQIRVTFDLREHRPRFDLPGDAHWLDEGCFMHGQTVYFLIDDTMSEIILAKKLKEEDFAYILEQKDEPWLNMEMKLDPQKLYEIKIIDAPNNRFELRLVWLYPRNTWVWPSGSKNYIVVNQHVHEVPAEVSSNQLLQLFPKSDTRVVTREELHALYHRYRSILDPFIDAPLRALVAPCWFADELQLRYYCRMREEKGRRVGYAVASLVVGDEVCDARQISEQITTEEIMLQGRRLNLDTMLSTGIGPFGYYSDGRPLEDILLRPEDILTRTFVDSTGSEYWLQLEERLWLEGGTPSEILSGHFNYLLHFGISGGAFLNGIASVTLLENFIRDYLVSPERRGKTLIVLHKEHLARLEAINLSSEVQMLQSVKDDQQITFEEPVHLIHYEQLEIYPALARQKWDLVIYVEPEKIFKSSSALHTKACSLQSTLIFCVLSETLRSLPSNVERLITKLFKWRSYRNLAYDNYLMRSLLKDVRFDTSRRRIELGFHGSILQRLFGQMSSKKEREDSRPADLKHELFGGFAVVRINKITPSQHHKKLLQSLRRLTSERPRPCRFAPCILDGGSVILNRPEQHDWFLYWRSEFRKGNYLESDEGYLLLMLIEIVNALSFNDRETGWKMLLKLSTHYTGISSNLDSAITMVLLDYAILFGNERVWRDLPSIPALERYEFVGNLKVQLRAVEDKQVLNLNELFRYLSFDFQYACRQCLSINPDKEEIEGFLILLQQVVDRIQNEVLMRTGQSIFLLFTPTIFPVLEGGAFQGVPNTIAERFELEYRAWSQHEPLSDFWLAVFKEVGNRYRKIKKIKGQLKTGYLSASYLEMIDAILPRQASKKSSAATVPALPPKPLELSRELLDKLRIEAEEVQRALEAGAGKDSPERTQRADIWASSRPVVPAGFGFGSDDAPWQEFIAHLQSVQREALLLLLSGKKDAQALQTLAVRYNTMPDLLLDEINELFMRSFGDLLIETGAAMPGINDEHREALKAHLKL